MKYSLVSSLSKLDLSHIPRLNDYIFSYKIIIPDRIIFKNKHNK